jgi:hypothetical protein
MARIHAKMHRRHFAENLGACPYQFFGLGRKLSAHFLGDFVGRNSVNHGIKCSAAGPED